MKKSYTLSLSRWHKVAERLSRTYNELTKSINTTFTNTEINGYLGDAQITRLREAAHNEMAKLAHAFDLQDALIYIRQSVGEANAKAGVATALAEYDAHNKRLKLFESILAAQTSDMISFDEIPHLPSQIVAENRYDRSLLSVRIRMLDAVAESKLRKDAENLRTKVYALADHINDLNCEKITLELPEDITQSAGL